MLYGFSATALPSGFSASWAWSKVRHDRRAGARVLTLVRMKKLKSHFEVSEWPLVVLTLLIVLMVNGLSV
jgi:hypothetical protein